MEKCTCSNCNKLFFYDPDLVPYRATDDNVCSLTVYEKIMTCPYCGTEFLLAEYCKEWD
jgi:hypothetical protein